MASSANPDLFYMNEPQTRANWASLILILALAYAVSGRIALLLALPPSYASAIFPPAGIALAFVMIYGWRVLPGVFLGSLLLNAWLQLSRGQTLGLPSVVPVVIACGSTVQAAVGKLAFRKVVEDGGRLDHFEALGRFFTGAPAVCLTSALVSLLGLLCIGAETPDAFKADFLTWWVGDTLGVVLCVPLCLLFIGRPRNLWKRRRLSVGVPLLIGIGLCVAVYLKTTGWENEQSLREFQLGTARAADAIQTHLDNQAFAVDELAAFMADTGRGGVTRDEFHRFASATLANMPEVAALEWVPCVTDAERARFEAQQARSIPGFRITERSANGAIVPSAQRNRYFPVTYAEPMAGNRTAIGFDLNSNVVRGDAIAQALTSGNAVATSPIELIQERQKQEGLILVRAVHSNAACPDLVLSVLRLGDFVRKSLPAEAAALDLRIDDVGAQKTVFGRSNTLVDDDRLTHQLQFGGRTYLLVSAPTQAYLDQHKGWQSLSLLAGCLFGTGLLGAFMLLSTGYAERTEMVVQERTAQFERESRKMTIFLRNASDGIHIIDANGRLFEVSESFCRMLGYTREEMIGRQASDWDVGARPDEIQAIVQAHLESRQTSTFEAKHRRKDGSMFDAEISVCPVDLQGTWYLFASSRDITQRKIAEQALRQSEHRLQSVTDRIPMRVSYVDNKECYRFVNLAYEEAFGRRRSDVNGMKVREVLGEGAYSQIAPYVARALAGETLSFDSEIATLEGYRCYRASYVPQFGEDGTTVLGFVAIVLDVTAQKLEERRLIELSQLDSLTGLLNPAGFLLRGREAIERCRESKRLMALMQIDIDHFKQVNDTLGHQVGDLLLKGIAGRLVKTLRAEDLVARPGGDEFAVIVEGLKEAGDAAMIAHKIVEAMRDPFILADHTVNIAISVGAAVYAGQPEVTRREVIKLADDLLYEVKRAGRNDFRVGICGVATERADTT
jgi:diguanylate cyclase (GGDEF)-like protein/PAS domain S-box-containing protein